MSQLDIIPDFLCIAKGLTGGFLPLALTVTNNIIYNQFLNDEWKYAFAHGHSYTANPLACSAAIASLNLLKQQATQNSLKVINQAHIDGISYLKANCPNIEHVRVLGTISAFDFKNDSLKSNLQLKIKFIEAGMLIRPLNKTIYLLPPYSITKNELAQSYQKIANIINQIQ